MARSWLVVLVAVLLAACTSTGTTGTPTPQRDVPSSPPATPPSVAPEPLHPEQALGDFGSLDFCSLLDQDKAAGAGVKIRSHVISDPNVCYEFGTVGGRDILVQVGELAAAKEDPERGPDVSATPLDQGLQVQRGTFFVHPTSCLRYLTFADGTHLSVTVGFTDNNIGTVDQRAALCTVEEAVFAGLVEHVTTRKAGHYDRGAYLGKFDMCTLMPDPLEVLGPASGLEVIPAPNRHRCIWLNPVDTTEVQLIDEYSAQPTGGTKITIDDQITIVSQSAGYCSLRTIVGATSWPGVYEYAKLRVRVPESIKDPCAFAKTVAAATWPKLP
ncbi:hypothetical protein FNH05_13795 [Amycolatopsis rhizosphaerae]|uniref:DUF3558 domain-containing protein n=1 Tax=Amycolatopsis rhizosphaerae TaxID=2053003 RepID=A0A558CT84_9PSEU|nr:hypothetical protein [Amycolatopsis rhizosphaerae]TVT51979.1 hypothetical protein FNH05_13795 [Amycolatopsis rhizosphaerae]